MDINEMKLGDILKIQGLFSKETTDNITKTHPFEIGKNYLIRTVTMIQTGRLIWVGEKEIVMEDAAWVADTGRFADAIKDSQKFNEVEPFVSPIIIGRGSIIDATQIENIITVQK